MRPEPGAIGGSVGVAVGIGEEAAELLIDRQMPCRRKLELGQRDMCRIEVDGDKAFRRRRHIGERIAAARRNGDHAVLGPELHAARSTTGSSQICG